MAALRSIGAVLAGLVVAVIVVIVFDILSSMLFGLPAGAAPTDQEALRELAANISPGAFVVLMIGWAIASFAGGWTAARIANRARWVHGLIFTFAFLLVGILNLAAIPHPVWVWVLGILAYVSGGVLGTMVASRQGSAATAP